MMTVKQVRFVKAESRNPVQDIAEVAVFDVSGEPVDPPTSGGGDVADSSVTTNKLANNAVTEPKIASNAVTTAKLADDAVTAAKIADGVIPTNATKEKAGLVKQVAKVGDPAGETPTKQEYIALRDALVNSGLMASA